MPPRVNDAELEVCVSSAGVDILGSRFGNLTRDLALDLYDARQQLADANAAIKRLQRELDGR